MLNLAGSHEPASPIRKYLPRHWAWIIAVALLFVAYCWWRAPHSYHQVGSYHIDDILLLPSARGFLTREAPDTYVLRDWQGIECWRAMPDVTLSAPSLPFANKRLSPFPFMRRRLFATCSLSPNGRTFAVADRIGQRTRVWCWRDGRQQGALFLPEPAPTVTLGTGPILGRFALQALDDGRVFVWFFQRTGCPAYLLDGGKLVARGLLPPETSLAPDGKSLITWQQQAAELSVQGTAIVVKNPFHIKDELLPTGNEPIPQAVPSTCAGGIVLTKFGVLYHRGIRQPPTERWELSTISPDGMHAFLFRKGHSRILCPQTGDAWEFRVNGDNKGGDTTLNGRYALAWTEINLPLPIRQLLTDDLGFKQLSSIMGRTYLSLYERPGRLRARMRMRTQQWGGGPGMSDEAWWYPSPDGHAIVLNIAVRNGYRSLLFRW